MKSSEKFWGKGRASPGLGVRSLGPFSPFVGGGLGAARVASGETRMTFPKTQTLVPGTRRTRLTWRLTAGLGMSWGARATLDFAWRYTDAGVIETGAGQGRVEWLDGSRDPVVLDLAPTQAPLKSHGLHAHASPHFASIRSRRKPRDTPAVP